VGLGRGQCEPEFPRRRVISKWRRNNSKRLADIVRNYDWPSDYTARVLRNSFVDTWQGKEAELAASSDAELTKWDKAWDEGHADGANVFISESVGLIRSVAPVATIIEEMVVEAEAAIRGATKKLS
jgi:nitronate monooxygenase